MILYYMTDLEYKHIGNAVRDKLNNALWDVERISKIPEDKRTPFDLARFDNALETAKILQEWLAATNVRRDIALKS